MSQQFSLFDASPPAPTFSYGRDLSPQQAKVRDHGAGNQVVVAGAGTGKTEALTQRILKLLVEGDGNGPIELEQILALTFTDKGAAEMRGRVYGRLVEILRALPRGAHRARLERIRAGFAENHRILTFDAFSFRLLGQFPDHSPLSGDVDVLDGGARRRLRRDVTRQFWNRVETTFSASQKRELWELLEIFPSRRAALEAIWKRAELETEAQLRQFALLPPHDEWREEFATLVSRDGEALWRDLELEIEKLDLDFTLQTELLDAERILSGGLVTQKDWKADFKKRWSPELLPGMERVGRKIRAWKAEALTQRDPALDWRSRRAVAALCAHALWWQGAHREWCAREEVAAFADISSAALEMLENPAVAAQVRDGFSHVLIDEFQDTNWRQWALLDALRDAKTGNVLVVGDEKQAIFRFRGGDITVFDGVRQILLGRENAADELTVSRRSTRQLVGWTNTVFRGVLPSMEARQPFEAPFQALQSEKDGGANGLWKILPAQWHESDENLVLEEKSLPAALQRERAARALARFLRVLCDDAVLWEKSDAPNLQFPDLGEISHRIARAESAIGVVFTTHDVKSVFEAQLRAYDVPFVAVKGTGFWNSDPVTWTLQLLQIWLDGSDQTAFVGLARSPLGGLSDVALLEWHLSLQGDENRAPDANCFPIEGFSPSREGDARAWAIFVSRLQAWRDLARVEAASEVLERVLESSELAFYEAGLPDAAQREQNWHKILDLLREREDAGEGGLRALIDYLTGLVREAENGDKEADAPLPAGGSIQLMTVFASKGLGFPMTILAQLDGAPQNKGSLLLRGALGGETQMAFRLSDDEDDEKAPKPWVWEKLRAQDAAEEDAQWRRLFYVACTRAESHLVVVCPENQPRNGAAWANLCAQAQEEMSEIRPIGEIPRGHEAKTEFAPQPQALLPPLSRAAPGEIFLSEIAGERAEKFASRARQWLENYLGAGADLREEIPFSAPTRALRIENAGFVVGAWEWVAVFAENEILLAATGQNREIAARRAILMQFAAQSAGFGVRETWALWPSGEQTESERV